MEQERTVMAVIENGQYVTRKINGIFQILATDANGMYYKADERQYTIDQIVMICFFKDQTYWTTIPEDTQFELFSGTDSAAGNHRGSGSTDNTGDSSPAVIASDSSAETTSQGEQKTEETSVTDVAYPKRRTRTTEPAKWERSSIQALIDAYRLYEPLFQSQTIRNEMVYEKIRVKLADSGLQFTRQQIMTKFKYLKKCYVEKKTTWDQKQQDSRQLLLNITTNLKSCSLKSRISCLSV